MAKNNPAIKPFVKWAGGKRQLLGEIKKHIPENLDDYTYYEPFVGAGAVLFELQPKKAVINDSNCQLMITYTAIKKDVQALVSLLKKHEKACGKNYYYEVRDMDRNPDQFARLSSAEKAARTIFLNKTCFNGLYRVNSSGFFNVPLGRYKNPLICNEAVLNLISEYLNSSDIKILNEDFESAASTAGKNSFVYFDPPYHSEDKTAFTGYQADGFGEECQKRLCNLMMELTKKGAKCLLSNSGTEFIRKLYNHDFFEIITVKAKRSINSNPAGRGSVDEVLIKNWRS